MEQQALLAGEVLKLEQLADDKSRALDQLAQLSQQRQQWMQTQGLTSPQAVHEWLTSRPALCDAWFQLEGAIKRAVVLNEFNGQQINQGLHRAREGLNVLKSAAASMMSYGPDGAQAQVPIGGRHLGSA
ncbi:flagellar export chaperone FlgN [Paludibacterium sp. B53371]